MDFEQYISPLSTEKQSSYLVMNYHQTYPADTNSDFMHNLPCNPADSGISKDLPLTDWSLSPLSWQYPTSLYDESPLSSLSSPSVDQHNSWSPFEQSFAPMLEERDSFVSLNQNAAFISPAWEKQDRYFKNEPNGGGGGFVSLAAMSEGAGYEFGGVDEENDTPKIEDLDVDSSVKLETPDTETSQQSGRTSSRSSFSRKPTIATRQKRRKSCSTISSIPTKTNHNQIEKQYRNRLNGQFEMLLETLPRDEGVGEGGKGDGKRIGKAEVLVRARSHILKLEREKKDLEVVNQSLESKVEELRRRWVGLGGVVLH